MNQLFEMVKLLTTVSLRRPQFSKVVFSVVCDDPDVMGAPAGRVTRNSQQSSVLDMATAKQHCGTSSYVCEVRLQARDAFIHRYEKSRNGCALYKIVRSAVDLLLASYEAPNTCALTVRKADY